MAYFETDRAAIAWYERALSHDASRTRLLALGMLARIDCHERAGWLERAQRDACPEVAIAALIVEVADATERTTLFDLFESDFAAGTTRSDLEWEWEYEIHVAQGVVLQGLSHRVWTAMEDDRLARRIALHRAFVGKDEEVEEGAALIVDKRFVTQYTRSPKSKVEAMHWRRSGRPRYSGR